MNAGGGGDGERGELRQRLARVREQMRAQAFDALLVRGTDRYLNEYVPAAESLRIWLTGFKGSVGDALVSAEGGWVFVDGRYHLQADAELDPACFAPVKVALGLSLDEALERRLVELATKAGPGFRVGFEGEKVSLKLRDQLRQALERQGGRFEPTDGNLVVRAGAVAPVATPGLLEAVPDAATGEGVASKLGRLREALARAGADAILLTRLDDIAWLSNLRAWEIDYASTFRALAWVGTRDALLFVDPRKLGDAARQHVGASFAFAPEQDWERELGARLPTGTRIRAILDPEGATAAHEAGVQRALAGSGEILRAASPVAAMKGRKNPAELRTMTDSFRRADRVVAAAIAWLNKQVAGGKAVTEAAFALEVERRFREAGARALSFRVIAAAGANGAVIHYSHPDPKRRIRKGELMLLDTGAYFEPGYATDLTRTFLAGGHAARADRKQKLIYTLVLKASIRGMKARFPVGTTGVQLDAIVRAPIWEAGYDYLHGTGHGVGVLVHEAPPRVATRSTTPLEPGQVFSIEPGIYLEGWGGVRIENLVTVIEDVKVPGFLRVKALTASPLDRRLIDSRLLSPDEKEWLRRYQRGRA